MSAAIIVPLSANLGEDRAAHWHWLRRRLGLLHPDTPVIEAVDDGPVWSKGRALAAGVAETNADVLVFMDADVMLEAGALAEAIEVVGSGWVVPHEKVYRLGPDVTRRLVAGPVTGMPTKDCLGCLERRPYAGVPTGGMVVMHRSAWEAAPLDPRFEGWGMEDLSWRWALRELVGPMVRLKHRLWHLHHAKQSNWNLPTPESKALHRRYNAAANRGPDEMRLLIEEFR